ncbi:RWD-domain-containing protein [Xylaria sp. CBS 124048]|nr:RWD-domain-containing protein [Xylaria sp. CBS 124048]
MDEDEDARDIELSTISAIYPEVQLDETDPHSFSVELPVTLSRPLTVLFPAVTPAAVEEVDSQTLLNLPALRVNVTLPDGYPQNEPPNVTISTSPPWLSDDRLRKLETDVIKLWEDIGRDQVIFTYIDDLQRASEDVFGLADSEGTLEVPPEHKIALLDYDGNAKRIAFEKETFVCGICLDPKKGIICHKMLDCGHVFCVQCLKDFYNNSITEGNVAAVICLAPGCAHERQKNAAKEPSNRRKPKTFISPSELLQIPIDQDMVKRYVMLKHKNKLESDKNTIYCPRSWCQGAARSKRHKKPEGLEVVDSDDDDEADEDTGLLAICEDCGFAFCSRCCQGWHGELNYCLPKQRTDVITEEEKASLEYLRLHSTPCPTCWAPCQKSLGCNHMQCFKCETHFCYLCSAWLDPSNPYRHFNTAPSGEKTGCYMRLWELEGGDGDDVGIDYEGGDAMRNVNMAAGQYGEHLDRQPRAREEQQQQAAPVPHEAPRGQPEPRQLEPLQQPAPERRAAVAREGPLVLRIGIEAPAAPRRDQPNGHGHRDAGAANPRGNGGHRGGHRDNRRGGGAGANQHQHQHQHNDRNRVHEPGRGGNNNQRGRGRRAQPAAVPDQQQQQPQQDNGNINPEQAAWIRQFVALALNDEEDLVDWDSD